MLNTIQKLLVVPFRIVAALLRLLLTVLTHSLKLLGGLLNGLARLIPLLVKLLRGVVVGVLKVLSVAVHLSVKLLQILVAVVLFPLRLVFGRGGN